MAKTAYLSRKLLNQLKVKETESTNLMLTHNLHNITINGKRVGCRNPSMGNTFLDMDETKTATKAQVNTIFDYISKFNRYDMNVSKVMAD